MHIITYSWTGPDDNRFDMRYVHHLKIPKLDRRLICITYRPFLYPPFYESWSFKKIDEAVERIEKAEQERKKWGA